MIKFNLILGYKYLDYNVHTRFFLLYTKDSLQGDELEN